MTRAAEQDRPDVAAARAAWRLAAPAVDPDRVVFVDETWASTKMGRTHGYGPRGEPVIDAVPFGHWKTTTFVAGLRASGVVAPVVIDGPITGDLFAAYVEQQLVKALRPGDVVVVDNLACHRRAGARAAIEAAGCELRFLPAYSPDLNPIELAFAKLKRRLRAAGHRTIPAVEQCLADATDAFGPAECAAYIRHCGYGVPPATDPPKTH